MTNSTVLVDCTGPKGCKISVNIIIDVRKLERNWIIYSPELKTFGYSEVSKDEAIKDFREALEIFFEVQLERGTLDAFFETHGWQSTDHKFIGSQKFKLPGIHTQVVQEKFSFA